MLNVAGTLIYTADLTPDNLDPSNARAVDDHAAPARRERHHLRRPRQRLDPRRRRRRRDLRRRGARRVVHEQLRPERRPVERSLRSDFNHPYNPGNVLGYSPTTTYQAQYDPNDPLREVKLTLDRCALQERHAASTGSSTSTRRAARSTRTGRRAARSRDRRQRHHLRRPRQRLARRRHRARHAVRRLGRRLPERRRRPDDRRRR